MPSRNQPDRESRSYRKAEIVLEALFVGYDPWNTQLPFDESLKIRRHLAKHKQNLLGTEDSVTRTKIIWANNGRKNTMALEPWIFLLANAIANPMGCSCALKTGSNVVHLFGSKQNLQLVYRLVVFFVHHCETNAKRFRKRLISDMKWNPDDTGVSGYLRSHHYSMIELLEKLMEGQYKRSRAGSRAAFDVLVAELEATKAYMSDYTMNSIRKYGGHGVEHALGKALSLPYNVVPSKDGMHTRRIPVKIKLV